MTRKLPLLWKHFRDYHKNMSYYSEKRQTKYKVKSVLANDEEFEIHRNTNCIIIKQLTHHISKITAMRQAMPQLL